MLLDKSWLDKEYTWSGLNSIIKVTSEVHEKSTVVDTSETRWYITSLDLNAEQALNAVRSHWQVESMHWILDMTFREDEYRIRKKQGPLAFNVRRKIARALLKQDISKTASMARKKRWLHWMTTIVHPFWSQGLKYANRELIIVLCQLMVVATLDFVIKKQNTILCHTTL